MEENTQAGECDETTETEGEQAIEQAASRKNNSPGSLWGFTQCGLDRISRVKQYCADLGRPMREVVNEALAAAFAALFATVEETQEARDAARHVTKLVGRVSGDPAKLAAEAEKLEARLLALRARLGTATAPTEDAAPAVAEAPSSLETSATPEELSEEAEADGTRAVQTPIGLVVVPAGIETAHEASQREAARLAEREENRSRKHRREPAGVS